MNKKPKIKKTALIKKTNKVEKTIIPEHFSKWQIFVRVMKKVGKFFLYTLGALLAIVVLFFIYINFPVAPSNDDAKMGVTFSSRYASDIGLDWRQAYIAMLDDLKMKHIRLPVYWDFVEKEEGVYDFNDLDWQIEQARMRDAKIILVVGQKVPRWPECFIPEWAKSNDSKRKQKLIAFEKLVVERYKKNSAIEKWQVENEPFLAFGVCPPLDTALLDREIAAVRSVDSTRPIVVTDSGELSLWINAASRADVFGTTMYREVYSEKMGHWRYPIGPNFFKAKQLLIRLFADQKNAIVIELQGEPWIKGWTVNAPLDVQLASMNANILKDNVEFAKKTGMSEIYVWGVEWWYWMKVTQNNQTLWDEAKNIYAK